MPYIEKGAQTEIGRKLEELAKAAPAPFSWFIPDPYDPSGFLQPIGGVTKAGGRVTKTIFAELSKKLQQLKITGLPLIEKDYFPTSKNVANKMIEWVSAGRTPKNVLEPHGGEGSLVREIEAQLGVSPKVLELSKKRVNKLRSLGIPAEKADFLKHTQTYDTIFMNPPFSKGQAKLHLLHGLELLEPGGRGVALVPGRELMADRPLARLLKENPNLQLIHYTSMRNPVKPKTPVSVGIIGFMKD